MCRYSVLVPTLISALALIACGRKDAPAKQAETPVATKHGLTKEQAKQPLVVIGDTVVTVGDFAEQLADKSPYLRARYASPERRRELLDELVRFELLAKEASRRGLDKSDEVQRTKRQLMVQQMMKAEFEDKVKLTDISDQEVQGYYDSHPEEFNKPAQLRASVIALRDEPKAKKLLKQVLEKRKDDELFRQLASTQNEDPLVRERAGDQQFFSQPSERQPDDPKLPDAVAEAAFKLENIGDIFPELVKTERGFEIVKLTGKRKRLERTLEQTRRPIQHKLWRERREAAVDSFVKSLREQAKIEENWALLEQVRLPAESPAAPEPRPSRGSPAGETRDRGRP